MMDHKYTYDLPGLLKCLEDIASGWEKLASDNSLYKEDIPEFENCGNLCPACEFGHVAIANRNDSSLCISCPMECGWKNGGGKCEDGISIFNIWIEEDDERAEAAAAIAKEARDRAEAVREAIRRGAE